jgi:hypothetical protein
MDADEPSPQEKTLIEERIAEHEPNLAAAVSLEEIEARLRTRFG